MKATRGIQIREQNGGGGDGGVTEPGPGFGVVPRIGVPPSLLSNNPMPVRISLCLSDVATRDTMTIRVRAASPVKWSGTGIQGSRLDTRGVCRGSGGRGGWCRTSWGRCSTRCVAPRCPTTGSTGPPATPPEPLPRSLPPSPPMLNTPPPITSLSSWGRGPEDPEEALGESVTFASFRELSLASSAPSIALRRGPPSPPPPPVATYHNPLLFVGPCLGPASYVGS